MGGKLGECGKRFEIKKERPKTIVNQCGFRKKKKHRPKIREAHMWNIMRNIGKTGRTSRWTMCEYTAL